MSEEESAAVAQAIEAAEHSTTAEIKLVLVRHCWRDLRARAEAIFHKHGLYETQERNAVLILLVTTNREFLIFGDEGVHQHVGSRYWCDVRDAMREHFRNNRIGDGLCGGISRIAQQLAEHFPPRAGDINELADEVVVDD